MRRISLVLVLAVASMPGLVPAGRAAAAAVPQVVVALIDTGINPYSPAFRDTSALAQQPPSAYLPDYPADCASTPAQPTTTCAIGLHLTLDVPYADGIAADAAVWSSVVRGQLYYVPGTKIVGAVSFGPGGTSCATAELGCDDRIILDDHGHGTMTSSRATGAPNSLAPTARVVMIEGLGDDNSAWAAAQPWIDVQSNSWGSAVPAPAQEQIQQTFTEIAKKQLVFVASGNGLAFNGVAPTPTWFDALAAQGVVLVGGHDNGRIAAWAGTPAQVVADAYAGFTAIHDTNEPMRSAPIACCTSAASPYAAGGGAAILLEARRILGDTRTGLHDGAVARGAAGLVPAGPLADGVFTLDELRTVVTHTAQARPAEGRDDGDIHFLGRLGAPHHPEEGPGENPFCQGCWTLPVKWTDVPAGYPAYAHIGYGAVNEFSVALATDVLSGAAALPQRTDVDDFFTLSDTVRWVVWGY
jgi:hypothetical protein